MEYFHKKLHFFWQLSSVKPHLICIFRAAYFRQAIVFDVWLYINITTGSLLEEACLPLHFRQNIVAFHHCITITHVFKSNFRTLAAKNKK